MNETTPIETTPALSHAETTAGEAERYYMDALGVRMRLWTNAERIAAGYAPVPENFISGLGGPPRSCLVECRDDEL